MVLHSYACSLGLPDLFISIEITSWELIPEELNLTDLVKLCGVVDPILFRAFNLSEYLFRAFNLSEYLWTLFKLQSMAAYKGMHATNLKYFK